MIFLAELDPSYTQVGMAVAVITALCVCANQIVSLWRNIQPRPPMDQQLREAVLLIDQKFATKAEIDRLERGIAERIAEIEKEMDANAEYVRHMEIRIFERIDQILDKVDKRLEVAHQRVDSLSGQIRYLEGKTAIGRGDA